MKKIVGIVAAASLVAGMAFADPTVNINFAEFTGSASVEWGVDLDAGKTGFKNQEHMKVTLNLFDAGEKTTSADGDVWAELVMKGGNCGSWSHKLYEIDTWTDYNAANVEATPNGGSSFDIDTAKLHFGDFYVGIQNGDTVTGSYKFDGAIRSADNGNAEWLKNVGPADYSQGIVAGFGNNNFGVDVDFRSYGADKNHYSDAYAIAAEAKLKDSNEFAEGLFVDLGGSMNLSKAYFTVGDGTTGLKNEAYENKIGYVLDASKFGAPAGTTVTINNAKTIGYSFNAGYKLKIDDKYWFKPAAGLTGTYITASDDIGGVSITGTDNKNNLVVGAMFGWGSTADANAGVYYLNGDQAKKVTPGVSVVAWIPLAEKMVGTSAGTTETATISDKVKAIITPAFFTNGELVEGLTVAAYSEMAILNANDVHGDKTTFAGNDATITGGAKDKGDTFALALAAGLKYDIKVDDVTVTPQAGIRYANTAYVDNEIAGYSPLSSAPVFATSSLGIQKKADSGDRALLDVYNDGFFNLKAGVNVSGLINNTSFFAVYESANLLNGTDYSGITSSADPDKKAKFYNVKLGTFNVGCTISF